MKAIVFIILISLLFSCGKKTNKSKAILIDEKILTESKKSLEKTEVIENTEERREEKSSIISNIFEIEISKSSKTKLKYIYNPPVSDEYPTVVFFAGGPGQAAMNKKFKSMPLEYGFLAVDIRGVGYNSDLDKDDLVYNSEVYADDYIKAIKDANLKKYVIYGISYGTMLATITSSKISKDNSLTPPIAVVLEGVLGKAFDEDYRVGLDALNHVETIMNSLDYDLMKHLKEKSYYGFKVEDWASFVEAYLYYGYYEGYEKELLTILFDNLVSSDQEAHDQVIELVRKLVRKNKEEISYASNLELYKEIVCNEIAANISGYEYDLEIKDGKFKIRDENLCADMGQMKREFDAKDWQIAAPIYYFGGDKDSTTPIRGAKYHFENQTETGQKILFEVIGGGHNALKLNLKECNANFWKSINSNIQEFISFGACNLSINILQ